MDLQSEDLEEETGEVFDVLEATIFLIDASASMFTSPQQSEHNDSEGTIADDDCPFISALNCVYNTLRSKIFTAPSDTVGVVLFGTNKSAPSEKYGVYANSYILLDLEKSDCGSIKTLKNMVMNGDIEEFKTLACSPQTYSIADSLWLCSSVFTKHKSKKVKRQIFLFTNEDEPHDKFSDKHKQAERRIGDLLDSRVDLFLFPIGENFDVKKIYQELFTEEESILSGSSSSEELVSKICRKCQKKRVVASLDFSLDPNLKFGVKVYNLTRTLPPPKHIRIDKRTNESVKSVSTKFNADTAEILLSSEVTNHVTIGDRKIKLNKTDLATLKAKFKTGFTLLGFKPVEEIKFYLHLSPGSFIYPDEDAIKGSRLLFGALLDRCKARNVAALCSFKATGLNKPRIVALLPEAEVKDGQALFGFHVIFLPYRNDIRKLDYDTLVGSTGTLAHDGTQDVAEIWRADPHQVTAAKAIVKKMTMNSGYAPRLFENPALHTKWKMIEGLAMEENNIEPVEDLARPNIAEIDSRLGERSATFNSLVFPMGYESPMKSTPKFAGPENEALVEKAARAGQLAKLTVEQLKSYLSGKGLRSLSATKKADLIEIIKSQTGFQ